MKAYAAAVILILILLCGVWWLLSNREGDIVNYPPKNETIVAFGDSLVFGQGSTAGNDFVSVLSRKLGRSIVNLGVPGDTTANGLARIEEVLALEPGIVILLLGGNDVLRRIDEETTRANLAELVTKFQAQGAVVVLLGVRGGLIRDGRESMFEEIALEHGAIYVPDVLDGIFLKPELMHDGIHPNDAGYAIIAERLFAICKKYELI